MSTYEITVNDILHNIKNLHQVVFEVTEACNLKCDYCIYSDLYEVSECRTKKYMSFEIVRQTIDYLNSIWNNEQPTDIKPLFISFYGGEPLLNISLIKQTVQYVESVIKNRKIFFSLTTNAMLLNKYMDYLCEKDMYLLISLDGNRESNIHRRTTMNEESFSIVYKNITDLKNKYPNYFKNRVNFNTVLTSCSSLDSIAKFFNSEFEKVPYISQINDSNINPDKIDKYKTLFLSKKESYMNSENKHLLNSTLFLSSPVVSQLIQYLFHYSGNNYNKYSDLFVDKSKAKILPTGTCTPFQKKMFITVSGKIMQCEKISHKYFLGEVYANSFQLDLEKVVSVHNGMMKLYAKQCGMCYKKEACSQCIFQSQNFNNGVYICEHQYDKKKYDEYISSNLKLLKEYPELYERILNNVVIY